MTIDKKFNGWTIGNIVFGGIPGFAVDAATGAMMKVDKNKYYLMFLPTAATADVVAKKAVEEETSQVSGYGDTTLERTVIRWYVESAPRGEMYIGVLFHLLQMLRILIKAILVQHLMSQPKHLM
ncbi:MAG: hypothetical protein R3Y22_04160 [Bacteroidales bacterium]